MKMIFYLSINVVANGSPHVNEVTSKMENNNVRNTFFYWLAHEFSVKLRDIKSSEKYHSVNAATHLET